MFRTFLCSLILIITIFSPTATSAQEPDTFVRNLDSDFSGQCDSVTISCASDNKFAIRTVVVNDVSYPLQRIEDRSQTPDSPHIIYLLKEGDKTVIVLAEGMVWDVQSLKVQILEWGIEPDEINFEFYLDGQLKSTEQNREALDE